METQIISKPEAPTLKVHIVLPILGLVAALIWAAFECSKSESNIRSFCNTIQSSENIQNTIQRASQYGLRGLINLAKNNKIQSLTVWANGIPGTLGSFCFVEVNNAEAVVSYSYNLWFH